jgi:hypothetical protein
MTSGLDRHRNKDGEISRKRNALVGTLRKIYGSSFATGASDEEKLGDILHKLDESSLTKLVEEHESLQRGLRGPSASASHEGWWCHTMHP